MNNQQLLNEILAVLRTVKDDKQKLEKIHHFFINEIYHEPEESDIPEKFKEVVSEIADALTAGMCCFFNPETLEWEDVPEGLLENEYDIGLEEDEMIPLKQTSWNRCVEIESMHSSEAFQIMEDFTNEVEDALLRNKLINALNNRKPFSNFKWIVEGSEYRQNWFDFRQKQNEYFVWRQIELEVEK